MILDKYLKKEQVPVFVVNIISLIFFIFVFIRKENYEFIMYVGVILFFLWLIIYTNKKIEYPLIALWGLTIWSIMHMVGGGIVFRGDVIYNLMILNLIGEPYNILKYDQVVHMFGFFVATLVMYYILKPQLKKGHTWPALMIVVGMAGLGLGAVNEIVEFIATVTIPDTNVGGYYNTSLDLISNSIGAIAAVFFIKYREKKSNK